MKTLLMTALLAATTACTIGSGTEPPLSYEAFKAKYVGQSKGRQLYDWDLPLKSEAQVKALYQEYLEAKTTGQRLSEATVATNIFGERVVWPAADAQNLTYCVSDSFGAYKGAVAAAMAQAGAEWSSATGGAVRFVHLSQYDASCSTATPTVFDVNPGDFAYAVAFFPDFPRDQRSVLIHPATFNGDFPPEGILRHELGHTLGLRHETTRFEALIEYGVHCFEDIFFEELTRYDDLSVMTTPACMGDAIKNKTLSLSAGDIEGINQLY